MEEATGIEARITRHKPESPTVWSNGEVDAGALVKFPGTATLDSRYTFTAQYLCASAMFARRSADIERANPQDPSEETRTEHRGLVTAAIMQSAAAVEAESAELIHHGPGSHLGSDRTDHRALALLKPLADVIDKLPALERYNVILHLLGKSPLREGEQPWQAMDTLVKLRNELVHYKSKWGSDMERKGFYGRLQQLKLARPPFVPPTGTNFFPHQLLGAACAAWAVRTSVAFINGFYDRLDMQSRLEPFMDRLACP